MWTPKLPFVKYFLPQIPQQKGFTSECFFICAVKLIFMNLFPQIWHESLSSVDPLWLLMCSFKRYCQKNSNPQTWQAKGFLAVWIIFMCLYKLALSVNLVLHISQENGFSTIWVFVVFRWMMLLFVEEAFFKPMFLDDASFLGVSATNKRNLFRESHCFRNRFLWLMSWCTLHTATYASLYWCRWRSVKKDTRSAKPFILVWIFKKLTLDFWSLFTGTYKWN